MVIASLIDKLKVENELGEGVIWDAAGAAVWWTDIEGSALYRFSPQDRQLQRWATPERLGSFALVADTDDLICGFASGFAYFNPLNGSIQWLSRIEQDIPGTRLNDGRADRQGRFWAGSMMESGVVSGEQGVGALYCLDHQLRVSSQIAGLSISNGLCWSPDAKTLYHTDTPSRCIYRYDFEPATGVIWCAPKKAVSPMERLLMNRVICGVLSGGLARWCATVRRGRWILFCLYR